MIVSFNKAFQYIGQTIRVWFTSFPHSPPLVVPFTVYISRSWAGSTMISRSRMHIAYISRQTAFVSFVRRNLSYISFISRAASFVTRR